MKVRLWQGTGHSRIEELLAQIKQGVQSVESFLQQVWNTEQQPETDAHLFRGQLDSFPLLPKLFRSPNTEQKAMRYERELLKMLKEVAPHLRPSIPDNDWDWLSLGQHYGMSTRMSDWSANPLIALFFAVELNPTDNRRPVVITIRFERDTKPIRKKPRPSTLNIPK